MTTTKYERSFSTVHRAQTLANYMDDVIDAYIVLGKEWVRCYELRSARQGFVDSHQRVAHAMKALYDVGLAERREVDDGEVEIFVEDYVYPSRDKNGEPRTFPAYTKKGEYLGEMLNPKYMGRRFWGQTKKKVHKKHTEYKILLAD